MHNWKNAKIQFDRDQKLFTAKLISQDEFDTSKAAYDALKGTVAADAADVTNAQLNLEYCEIRAPFDGKTGSLQFHEGNVIKAQDDTLLTINRIHPIYVTFAVPERYLAEIKKEMRKKNPAARATFDGMDGAPVEGELTFINNAVDENTGTIQLKATFPNEKNELWPGNSCAWFWICQN
ncbi:MAG: efflux RND transporter periplasmic adaptor subunit [Limisphaerales bacterium]